MNSVPEIEKDLVRWSRKRWAGCFLLIFATQVGGILWASRGPSGEAPPQRNFPRVALQENAPALLVGQSAVANPMLFAAADAKGFSGEAWLYPKPWNYHYDGLIQRLDFVHFADATRILRQPSRPVPPHRVDESPFFSATQSRASRITPREPAGSRLRIEGELENRPILSSAPLPLQRASDVLNSSVVQAGVNRDGIVVSSRLLERSRSKAADQTALDITRKLRFAPDQAEGPEITWGKLIFQWFAVESVSTNAAPR